MKVAAIIRDSAFEFRDINRHLIPKQMQESQTRLVTPGNQTNG